MPNTGTRGLPGLYLNLLEVDVAHVPHSRQLSHITTATRGQGTRSVPDGRDFVMKQIRMVSGAVDVLAVV